MFRILKNLFYFRNLEGRGKAEEKTNARDLNMT